MEGTAPMSDEEPTLAAPETTKLLTWEGVALTVPADIEDVDPDVLEAFENGKAITALRAIFGSDEYERIRTKWAKLHDDKRPVMRDINRLYDVIAEHFGFNDSGE